MSLAASVPVHAAFTSMFDVWQAFADFGQKVQAEFLSHAWGMAAGETTRPALDFHINDVTIDGQSQPVITTERAVSPFTTLWSFQPERQSGNRPATLIVAPDSLHAPTIVGGLAKRRLEHSNVLVLGCNDPRDVPVTAGMFDPARQINDAITVMAEEKVETLIGISQSGVTSSVALGVMAANDALRNQLPKNLVVIGSPIDTRVHPNNLCLAAKHWPSPHFVTVGSGHIGRGQQVMPVEVQQVCLGGDLPCIVLWRKQMALWLGVKPEIAEHMALQPVPRAFIEQTLQRVYRNHHLPEGRWMHDGAAINVGGVEGVRVMTVEATSDQVVSRGQTHALQTIMGKAAEHQQFNVPGDHIGLVTGPQVPVIAQRIQDFTLGQ